MLKVCDYYMTWDSLELIAQNWKVFGSFCLLILDTLDDLMKPCETQVKKDAQCWNWCPAFSIEPRQCPWLGMCFSFYTFAYRMQVQRLFASPAFSIPPKLILMLTVLPGCHVCAQFASGLQVPGIASDQTWSRLAEKDRSESHWIHLRPQ